MCVTARSFFSPLRWAAGDSEIDQIYRIFRYALRLAVWRGRGGKKRAAPLTGSTQATAVRGTPRGGGGHFGSVLGTPNEETWPGFTSLKQYNSNFPRYRASRLDQSVPGLCADGLDLLKVRVAASASAPAVRGWVGI